MSRWFNSVIVICCAGAIAIFTQTSLAVAEEQEVVNMVMDALKSDDPQMRAGAITILREIPGEEVTKSLVAALPSLPPAGQVQLISALADRGDRTALPAVVESLKSGDISVRMSALKSLGQLGDVSSIALLAEMAVKTTGDEQKAARESLYCLSGSEIDEAILQNLDSAEPKIKIELIRAVGERNILTGLQALLKTAKDPDDRVRAESLRSLKYIAPADSLPTLIDLLLNLASESDRDETEKTIAAVAHKIEAGKGQAAAVLAVLPSVNEPAKRASLFRVLGRIADDTALPALTAALGSKDSEVQDAAVRALADWPTCQPLTDLLKIVQTSDNEVHKVLSLRGFVRMLGLPSDRPSKETIDLYVKAMSLAPSPDEKKRVLSGLANTKLLESMIVAAEYLNDIALYQEAELAVLQIAQGICGSYPEQTKTVLNKIIAAAKQDELIRKSQETIDRIERFGDYITAWQVSGPYTRQGTDGVAPFDVAFAPEQPDGQRVTWQIMPAGTNNDRPWLMELGKVLRGEDCTAYMRTSVWSEKDRKVRLELGIDGGVKVWLNSQLVHANNESRSVKLGQDNIEVALREGWNELLLKVTPSNRGWAVCARFRNLDGSKLEAIKIQAE